MLRTISPNISVITNFGCRANCWYCIWKGHDLEHVNDPTDWKKLENFFSENKEKGKVSVSGGSDCLYKYREHAEWWQRFFELTDKYDLIVDVHTREKFYNDEFFINHINRCVFSSDRLLDDIDYLSYVSSLTKVRITHLVTTATSVLLIEEYLKFQQEIGCQFTLKELIGYDDGGMYKKIKKLYPDIYYLDAGDYNIYYMPDNSIRENFL